MARVQRGVVKDAGDFLSLEKPTSRMVARRVHLSDKLEEENKAENGWGTARLQSLPHSD